MFLHLLTFIMCLLFLFFLRTFLIKVARSWGQNSALNFLLSSIVNVDLWYFEIECWFVIVVFKTHPLHIQVCVYCILSPAMMLSNVWKTPVEPVVMSLISKLYIAGVKATNHSFMINIDCFKTVWCVLLFQTCSSQLRTDWLCWVTTLVRRCLSSEHEVRWGDLHPPPPASHYLPALLSCQ